MEEIKTSFEKIFDQFTADSTAYTQPKRLSFNYLEAQAEPISKKRKLSAGTMHNSRIDQSVSSVHDTSVEPNATCESSLNISNASLSSSPFEIRRLKADAVDYKAQIAQMKQELETRIKTHAHMEDMYTEKVKQLQKQVDTSSDKIREMDKHLKHIRKREAAEKLELIKTKNVLAQQKRSYDDHISQLQRNKMDMESTLRQTKRDLNDRINELENQYAMLEQKFTSTRDELESLEQNSERLQEKGNHYNALEAQFEVQTQKLETVQRRVVTLEEEIVAFGNWKKLSKTFQGRISKIPDLERELESLKRENKNLNDNIGNKLLLEEQVHELKTRLEKNERSHEDNVAMKAHVKSLEAELREFKAVATDHCAPNTLASAANLRARIETILQNDLILMSDKGTTKNESDSVTTGMQELKKQAATLIKANGDLQTSLKYHKTSLHRVQKKLMLVAKERECYKQIIENYEKDLTISSAASETSPDSQTRMKLEMLEKSLNGYKELCAAQEKELLASKTLPDLGLSTMTSDNYERFKKEMEVLRAENEQLRRRKEELELTVEQINLKGAYNLDKYKIVHMTRNPSAEAQETYQVEVEKLQAEIERLRRKNAKLLQNNEEMTVRFTETMNITHDIKELTNLREQLSSLESKNKYLKDFFRSSNEEFRHMIYLMFGFKVRRLATGMYKISSMYANSENDELNFQLSESGDLQLVESDYSNSLAEMIQVYLGEHASVPLFLGTLTIQLFNNQTIA